MKANDVVIGANVIIGNEVGQVRFKKQKGGTTYLYLDSGRCAMVPKDREVICAE